MRYISLFSGIEAASVAWGPLGWEPVAFSEIDPFPKAVLHHHYPSVPDLGDITKIDWTPYVHAADVVVGGSPCQSFSIAGTRTGLDGASGLMWEYVRAVRELRPQWIVWENVPGALSSAHGEDFRCLLESLDDIGYGLAWRVLDAQFLGVPQRRRRVFLVGSLGATRSSDVLFEPESLSWDTASSREKRQALTRGAAGGIGGAGGSLTPWDTQSRRIYGDSDVYPTLDARPGKIGADGRGVLTQYGRELAGTLTARADGSPTGDRGPNIVASFSAGQSSESGSLGYAHEVTPTLRAGASGTNQVPSVYCMSDSGSNSSVNHDIAPTLTVHEARSTSYVFDWHASPSQSMTAETDLAPTLRANVNSGGRQPAVSENGLVRRLTPVECERLQGFPDCWTDIPYKGRPHPADGPRYRALGNSMAVPVMRWIGERIEEES